MNRDLLIFLDKTVFQVIFYFFLFFSKLLKKRQADLLPQPTQARNFLVIRPGGLGDALMTVPFLKALRKVSPEGRITLVCVGKNSNALANLPYFDDLIIIDRLGALWKNMAQLREADFDIAFDLEPFRKISTVIAFLSGTSIRVGFDTNIRRRLFTHYVTYANEKCYESLNYTRQLKAVGIQVSDQEAGDMSFPLSEDLLRRTNSLLQSHGITPAEDDLIAVVPGVLKPHHRWEMQNFSSLIDLIQAHYGKARIILLGTDADMTDIREVLQHVSNHDRIVNLAGKTDFMDVLGILHATRILIGCDGGIVYMAAAMGCSTVSIWGPGVMERFKPPGWNHIGIRKDYFCVPCVNYSRLGEFPGCSYNRRCLRDISAEEVFEQFVALDSRIGPRND